MRLVSHSSWRAPRVDMRPRPAAANKGGAMPRRCRPWPGATAVADGVAGLDRSDHRAFPGRWGQGTSNMAWCLCGSNFWPSASIGLTPCTASRRCISRSVRLDALDQTTIAPSAVARASPAAPSWRGSANRWRSACRGRIWMAWARVSLRSRGHALTQILPQRRRSARSLSSAFSTRSASVVHRRGFQLKRGSWPSCAMGRRSSFYPECFGVNRRSGNLPGISGKSNLVTNSSFCSDRLAAAGFRRFFRPSRRSIAWAV